MTLTSNYPSRNACYKRRHSDWTSPVIYYLSSSSSRTCIPRMSIVDRQSLLLHHSPTLYTPAN